LVLLELKPWQTFPPADPKKRGQATFSHFEKVACPLFFAGRVVPASDVSERIMQDRQIRPEANLSPVDAEISKRSGEQPDLHAFHPLKHQ
jgi:hypothetical protein